MKRVAFLSFHTCPLLQPGSGWAGGMNVYIDELARALASEGVQVDVFTRRHSADVPGTVTVAKGVVLHHVDAGPARELPPRRVARFLGVFTDAVIDRIRFLQHVSLVHSHYWLSGWSGVLLKERLDVPLANSFPTLGRVKDLTRRTDEEPSSPMRTLTEEEVIAQSDCVIASTPYEFDDLLDHYGATPERLCTSPPGINHQVFRPGNKAEARRWFGFAEDVPIILFVGRIQPLKAADVAIAALAHLPEIAESEPDLLLIGGPSGPAGHAEMERLRIMTKDLGVDHRVHFLPTQPHEALPRFYHAADVLVVPSRSETFGLVAAEAQACGLPVVAADVGGSEVVEVVDVAVVGASVGRTVAEAVSVG